MSQSKVAQTFLTVSDLSKQSQEILSQLLERLEHLDLTGKLSAEDQIIQTAHGGNGDVYAAYIWIGGKKFKVALKRLRIYIYKDKGLAKLIAKEIKIWSCLCHPNVLELLGYILEENGFPSLISRWMGNGTALEYVRAHPEADVLPLVVGIGKGLEYLHQQDVVHSDIKSDNVLISDAGVPLICDFGTSRMLAATQTLGIETTSEKLKGSLRWLAMELFTEGQSSHTKESDVWAFGMTAYELLVKDRPYYHIRLEFQVMFAIAKGDKPLQPEGLASASNSLQTIWRVCDVCWRNAIERPPMSVVVAALQGITPLPPPDPSSAMTQSSQTPENGPRGRGRWWRSSENAVTAKTTVLKLGQRQSVPIPLISFAMSAKSAANTGTRRRHDSLEEKAEDAVQAEIRASHRFDSFAGERGGNFVKWHVDGHDYMYALSEMLDGAKECIFILDWWLTPELYLRRPPAYHPEWRLDRVLKRKAEEGVRVYVVVYEEVTQTMSMSSHHTKEALEALHPNITCMRHRDRTGSRGTMSRFRAALSSDRARPADDAESWSHHEKVVVVDNHRACIGGLGLCFGRWDTHTHPLADVHPTDFSRTLFPGQDYNNARMLDFQHVDKYAGNTLSVLESARMPWHDVHMTLTGDVVLDIVQHFVERWNEIKRRKYETDEHYEWLALPHDVVAAPNEAVVRHPRRVAWHSMGRHFRQRFHIRDGRSVEEDPVLYPRPPTGSCRVQAVRSVSDWSHGVLTETSVQNAYIQLIMEANHYIYIENQFFISNTGVYGPVKNLIAKALVDRILMAARDGANFKVVIVIPEVPGFSGNIKDESTLKTIMAAQYRTINRGGRSIYEEIHRAGYDPEQYIKFYHLRTYDRLNAPYSFIKDMEQNSGVKFAEAQVALARQWIGDLTSGAEQQNRVLVARPPTGEGLVATIESDSPTEEVSLPQNIEAAREVIERFERGANQLQSDVDVSDNVGQHALLDNTELADEKWLGSEEEEKSCYVSEQLYIHSKVMVVDDRRAIIGSASINDRSQKGDGDSEIALVVDDCDMFQSTMDGRSYMAARFAATLRRQLYKEHLGLIPPQTVNSRHERVTSAMRAAPIANDDETTSEADRLVADPLGGETVALWERTARTNRNLYTEVFRPVPSNLVRDWKAYDNYVPKVKTGHVVPGVSLDRVKNRLSCVRGQLVECPLDFLIDQKDLVENADWSGFNPALPVYI